MLQSRNKKLVYNTWVNFSFYSIYLCYSKCLSGKSCIYLYSTVFYVNTISIRGPLENISNKFNA
jgi:hypothetical protein